ncbi:hypothetical protein M8J76_010523 [Diaphorina citri]|nr:hypothetical protein M8J75_005512 [Diaphorina citri]KAI5741122.1 hypothetical protein M8J76_010523 [Diaphorina citri]
MVAMEVDDDAFKRPAPPKEKSKEKTSFTIFEIFNFAQKEETDLVKVVKKMAEIYKSLSLLVSINGIILSVVSLCCSLFSSSNRYWSHLLQENTVCEAVSGMFSPQ